MHGINYTATECMGLMFEGKRNQQISVVNVLEFDKCHKKIEHARTPFAAKLINSLDAENIGGSRGRTGSDVQWGVQKLTEY